MQLKSNKISPKNVYFPRSETNQQTVCEKLTVSCSFSFHVSYLKVSWWFNQNWKFDPLRLTVSVSQGVARPLSCLITESILYFFRIAMNVSNMKNAVNMSKKMLIFRISACWFVSERGKSTFLGIILFDFSCILLGHKFFVIFRPIEMKLRSFIEIELSFPLVLEFRRSDENCRKYGVLSVFFYSGGIAAARAWRLFVVIFLIASLLVLLLRRCLAHSPVLGWRKTRLEKPVKNPPGFSGFYT